MGSPRKADGSYEPRFLFVNQDASTLLTKDKDVRLDRSKQSHVQRQQFAKKREAAIVRLKRQPSSMQDPNTLAWKDPSPTHDVANPDQRPHDLLPPLQAASPVIDYPNTEVADPHGRP